MTQSQAPAGQHGCARCTARWTGHNTCWGLPGDRLEALKVFMQAEKVSNV